MDYQNTRYVKNSLLTLVSRITVLILLVGINAVIGRTIGPSGKGLISLLTMVGGFIAALATLGFEYANVYFLGKDRGLKSSIFTQNLLLLLVVTIFLLPLLSLSGEWLSPVILKNLPTLYWVYAILTVPFFMVVRLSMTYFQGLEDFTNFNFLEIGRYSGYLLLAVLILVVMKKGMFGGVELVISQAMLGAALSALLVLRRGHFPGRFDLNLLRNSFSMGIKAHIGQVLQFFNYRLDLFLVNFYLGVFDVGLYAAAVSIGELLWHLPSALSLTLFPRAAGLSSEESALFSAKILRISMAISLAGSILLILTGKFLLLIYGKPFREGYPALVLLLPGIFSFGIAKIAISFLHGRGKPLYGTYLTLFSLIFTVIFDILLIPLWGIKGAAVASSFVYTLGGVLSVAWFKKESKLKYKEFLLVNRMDLKILKDVAVTLIRGIRRFT